MRKNILMATASLAVAATFAMPKKADAQTNLPTIKMCTGLEGLNYELVGIEIKNQMKGIANVVLQNTAGSLANLDNVKNKVCDVAPVQMDSLNVYGNVSGFELATPLYDEYWHLVCNPKSGITRITQLKPGKNIVYIGPNGGGTSVTWASFVKADPGRYKDIIVYPRSYTQALANVLRESDECLAVVTGLNANTVQKINDTAKENGGLTLVPSNDKDILNTQDSKHHLVYKDVQIPDGAYSGGLQPKSIFGSAVPTVATTSIIIANSDWTEANSKLYDKFLDGVTAALPAIKAKINAK